MTPEIQDALRSRFETQGLAIAQLPETIEDHLLRAAQMLAETLLNEKKIICLGIGDGEASAHLLTDELLHSSQLERPPLPCVFISGNASKNKLAQQIKAICQPGDSLVVFKGSHVSEISVEDEKLAFLFQETESLETKSILTSRNTFPIHNQDNSLQLIVDTGTRMNYLCSMTVIGLTLAALVDYQLFEHPI